MKCKNCGHNITEEGNHVYGAIESKKCRVHKVTKSKKCGCANPEIMSD